MRRLPVAIVVSVASHGSVLGWLVASGSVLAVPLARPVSATAPAAPAVATASTPAPDAIELELFDLPRVGPALPVIDVRRVPPPRSASPGAPVTSRPTTAPSEISTGAAPSAEPEAAPKRGPVRSPWMRMRPPDSSVLRGMSQEFIDNFLARSRPLAPRPDIPDERLAEDIAEERRALRSGHGDLARIVELNEQRAHEDLRPSGGGSFHADDRTFATDVAPDGSARISDKPRQLDTQDLIMKRMGVDPYGRNKLALLDRTRDQRVALGERHRRIQLAHAAELALRNVEQLWATTPDLAGRKRGLFELWDDCAETGSDDIVAGGAAGRGIVIGAIRARLRGPDAYTAAELAALNAIRRSNAVFAPYD